MVAFAPICVFAYKRPDHFGLTINSLVANPEASQSDLWVFIDGAKTIADEALVSKVRALAQAVTGFKTVTVIERDSNLGLSNSVISGVLEVLARNDRIIVLEDDMVASPFFLKYMNDGLELYAQEERVISIHGYVYPLKVEMDKPFFVRGADCWGWATWRRGWALFEADGSRLLEKIINQGLAWDFDINGSYPYLKMLRRQVQKKNDSWAIRWYASAFLQNKLTLYPNRSLIKNIGNDDSGTHCGVTTVFESELSATPISFEHILVEESLQGRQAIASYFRSLKSNVRFSFEKFSHILRKWLFCR